MASVEAQKWQTALMKDILNNGGNGWHKAFTMPSDSGVTAFIHRIVSEINLYSNENAKILVIVKNRYVKNELLYSLKPQGMSVLMGATAKTPDQVVIAVEGEELAGYHLNYIDWVIADNVKLETIDKFIGDRVVNNSVYFWTI